MVQTARLFLAGSSIYPAIELLYRKKTHVSMAVAGGTSLCFINKVCNGLLKQKSLPVKGLVVNVMMKRKVWDYSNLPLNIKGQVCLPFTVIWGLITIPALMICKLLKCK